jgi:hypothetical protein
LSTAGASSRSQRARNGPQARNLCPRRRARPRRAAPHIKSHPRSGTAPRAARTAKIIALQKTVAASEAHVGTDARVPEAEGLRDTSDAKFARGRIGQMRKKGGGVGSARRDRRSRVRGRRLAGHVRRQICPRQNWPNAEKGRRRRKRKSGLTLACPRPKACGTGPTQGARVPKKGGGVGSASRDLRSRVRAGHFRRRQGPGQTPVQGQTRVAPPLGRSASGRNAPARR